MLTQATFHAQLLSLTNDAEKSRYLLAISGGVDSMVMLYLFSHSNFKFEVAHVNYKLRGDDSDADQRIVEDFCSENGIILHCYTVSEKDQKPQNSIQLWARELRYDFFRKIQKKMNLQFIITAHHLNDQLETFIINLSRGSGLKGLSGIPANENQILRPLLNFSKDEIYTFAELNQIPFREDISNTKSDYLRNKIRIEITPNLLDTNTQFLSNFAKSIDYLGQSKTFVEEQILNIENEIISTQDDTVIIHRQKLMAQTPFVKFEILRKFGFELETEIQKICSAEKGKFFKSATHTLTIDRDVLIITPIDQTSEFDSTEIIIAENLSETSATLSLNKFITDESVFSTNFLWQFDVDKIQFPLKLRHKEDRDVFFPFGMLGSKKISKFFKDEKIPIFTQRKIWLLCDANDCVLGVIPYRQDRRFASGKDSENKISIKF